MRNSTSESMDTSQVFCPNMMCSERGQRGSGKIVIHDRNRQRYRCKVCKKTFSARRGTMFEGLRKPTELIVIVVTLLSYGCPIQAIVHAFSLDERTVARWRDRAGVHCQKVHQRIFRANGAASLLEKRKGTSAMKPGFLLEHKRDEAFRALHILLVALAEMRFEDALFHMDAVR